MSKTIKGRVVHDSPLPAHPVLAMQQLIRISQALLDIANRETQALLLNDMLAFSILQYEQDRKTMEYAAASQEFRRRVEEFRGVDHTLLDRLEKLQIEISLKTQENMRLAQSLEALARKRTEGRTLNAHVIAQTGRLHKHTSSSREGATT